MQPGAPHACKGRAAPGPGTPRLLARAPQGTAIEATLWRELAERYFDVMEEGKVRCRVCPVPNGDGT